MAIIHISEAEAARDFAALLARVRSGAEVLIENGSDAVAVVRRPSPKRLTVSECIALARRHEEEFGDAPVLDADFAADVEDLIRERSPWNPPQWD